jgi:hypothetical protein
MLVRVDVPFRGGAGAGDAPGRAVRADLARLRDPVAGVIAVDAFLHAGLVPLSGLETYAAERAGRRGLPQLRRVLSLPTRGRSRIE